MAIGEFYHVLKTSPTLFLVLLQDFYDHVKQLLRQFPVLHHNSSVLDGGQETGDSLQGGHFNLDIGVLKRVGEQLQEVLAVLDDQILRQVVLGQYFEVVESKLLSLFVFLRRGRLAHKSYEACDQLAVLILHLPKALADDVGLPL